MVGNRHCDPVALELYRLRRGIELLFSHLKKRGFDLESTRMTDSGKLEKLMAALRRKSDFRYGFKAILRILMNPADRTDESKRFF